VRCSIALLRYGSLIIVSKIKCINATVQHVCHGSGEKIGGGVGRNCLIVATGNGFGCLNSGRVFDAAHEDFTMNSEISFLCFVNCLAIPYLQAFFPLPIRIKQSLQKRALPL
jgi:hypothetical protein